MNRTTLKAWLYLATILVWAFLIVFTYELVFIPNWPVLVLLAIPYVAYALYGRKLWGLKS